MSQFRVVPSITMYDTFATFCTSFEVGARDLILTDRVLYEMYLSGVRCAGILIEDDYGAGEPDDKKVSQILLAARALSYDRVIAVGGGSVMDIGKLLSLAQTPEMLENLVAVFERKIPVVREKALILIPTTCGTGSEITNISVCSFSALGTKIGLADDALYADHAVLVSELISSLPMRVFMDSSTDALIHAIESFLSPKANIWTQMFSVRAIAHIVSGYRHIQQNGADSRSTLLGDFLSASAMAGIAFSNAGCGLIHAMSYPIGANYHLPHGASNYEVMMAVLRFYKDKAPGGTMTTLCDLVSGLDTLEALLSSLSPRRPMRTYGMDEAAADAFAKDVIEHQQRLLANCYIPVTQNEIAQIYRAIL